MNRRLSKRPTVAAALVVVTVLVASSCIWSGPYGDSRSLRFQPDTDITVADVAGLVTDWTATIGSTPQTPVIDGDMAVVASGTTLRGFSAQGCAATTCAPVWEASDTYHFGQPMIHAGVVYVNVQGVLHAYDADGSSGCTGSPLVCAPLWTAPGGIYVTIGDGVVVVSGYSVATIYEPGDGTGGSCSGSPRTCQPLRFLDIGCFGLDPDSLGSTCASGPASVGDGIVAIGSTIDERFENPFDPDSSSHSGGLTTFAVDPHTCVAQPPPAAPVCPPLTQHWLGSVSKAPAIRDGLVTFHRSSWFQDGSTGETYSTSGVATLDPATNTFPLSAISTDQGHSADGEVALVDDTIFELNGASVLARAASDGSLRWSAPLPAAGVGISVGSDVVYVTTTAGVVHTFDADGVQGCSGSPTTCATLADLSASETTSISNNRLWLARPGHLRVLREP